MAVAAVKLAADTSADAIMTVDKTLELAQNLANQKANFVNLAVLPTDRLANRASLLSFTRSFIGTDARQVLDELKSNNFFGKDAPRVVVIVKQADTYQMKLVEL